MKTKADFSSFDSILERLQKIQSTFGFNEYSIEIKTGFHGLKKYSEEDTGWEIDITIFKYNYELQKMDYHWFDTFRCSSYRKAADNLKLYAKVLDIVKKIKNGTLEDNQ